jgi:hypothetical protein
MIASGGVPRKPSDGSKRGVNVHPQQRWHRQNPNKHFAC